MTHSALRQLAAESAYEFSLFISGQGTLSSVSKRVLLATLHAPGSLRGKPLATLVRRPDGRPFGPSFLAPRTQTNPQRRSFSIIRRDGRTFVCRGRAYYLAGTRRAPGGVLLLGNRIRTIAPAAADLLKGRAGAVRLAASLRDGLCVVDDRGAIAWADPALAGMAGRHPSEMIGISPPYPWFGDSENRRLAETLGRVARTGAPGHLLVVLEQPDERSVALSFAISPLHDCDGLFLASVRDISDVHPARESQMAERRIERLKQQLGRNAERLKTLVDVNRSVLKSGSLTDVFRRITGGVGALVDHDLAGIYIFDGEENILRPHTLSRLTAFSRRLGKFPITPGEGIVGSAALTGETVLANDAQHDPRSVYPPGMRPETEHIIAAPLLGRRSTYGILTVARNRHPGFHDEDAQIVQSFADAASIAIDSVIFHEESARNSGEPHRSVRALRSPPVAKSGGRIGGQAKPAPGRPAGEQPPLPGAGTKAVARPGAQRGDG